MPFLSLVYKPFDKVIYILKCNEVVYKPFYKSIHSYRVCRHEMLMLSVDIYLDKDGMDKAKITQLDSSINIELGNVELFIYHDALAQLIEKLTQGLVLKTKTKK